MVSFVVVAGELYRISEEPSCKFTLYSAFQGKQSQVCSCPTAPNQLLSPHMRFLIVCYIFAAENVFLFHVSSL